MKQHGTEKQQVTHMSAPATFPDFSPDGIKIVFTAKPAGSPTRDIYVIGSDGSGLTQLTSGSGDNAYPAFSPDGTKIVLTSRRPGPSQVWGMNAGGRHQTPA